MHGYSGAEYIISINNFKRIIDVFKIPCSHKKIPIQFTAWKRDKIALRKDLIAFSCCISSAKNFLEFNSLEVDNVHRAMLIEPFFEIKCPWPTFKL